MLQDNHSTARNDDQIYLSRAAEVFNKSIPFKVYRINDATGIEEHSHDYMQIWYMMYGRCKHIIKKNCNELAKGDIFVIPPFVAHEIKVDGDDAVDIIGCEFSASFINENIPHFADKNSMFDFDSSLFDFAYLEPFLVTTENIKPRLHLKGEVQIKVENLMSDMLEEYQNERKYYELNIKADLLKLLSIVAREYENSKDSGNIKIFARYRDSIQAAINYINENYTSQIYIDDICKMSLISNTYFSHIFKQITGKTFVEYVNYLRIRKAMELLIASDAFISNISLDVGFNDMAYFYRVFRKETGLSPSQYRNLNSGRRKNS